MGGLVLVDPSHENLGKEISALDPVSEKRNAEYVEKLKKCLVAVEDDLLPGSELYQLCVGLPGPRYSEAIQAADAQLASQPARVRGWVSEMINVWTVSAEDVRASYRKLGDIPIAVLTKEPAPPGPDETQELRRAKNEVWLRLHSEIAEMSSRGQRITVPDTGHYIQLDQPWFVVEAIKRVLTQTEKGSCDAL